MRDPGVNLQIDAAIKALADTLTPGDLANRATQLAQFVRGISKDDPWRALLPTGKPAGDLWKATAREAIRGGDWRHLEWLLRNGMPVDGFPEFRAVAADALGGGKRQNRPPAMKVALRNLLIATYLVLLRGAGIKPEVAVGKAMELFEEDRRTVQRALTAHWAAAARELATLAPCVTKGAPFRAD